MSEPYGEDSISVLSNRDAVLKRPGMFFGDLASGDAYACIIHEIAEAALSWQIGANISLDLLPDNEVELSCYAHLPENQRPHEQHGSRPIQVLTPQLTWTGFGHRLTRGAEYAAIACQHMVWEIRDRFGEGCTSFNEGHCISACGSATDSISIS